jgi:pentatricopeptide repeat protein
MSRSFKVVVSQIIFGGSSLVNICAIHGSMEDAHRVLNKMPS